MTNEKFKPDQYMGDMPPGGPDDIPEEEVRRIAEQAREQMKSLDSHDQDALRELLSNLGVPLSERDEEHE